MSRNVLLHTRLFCPQASRLGVIAVLAAFLALTPQRAFCQSTFASLVGTVQDETGAVVHGAAVNIDNVGTAARRSTLSGENGAYTIPNLEPGSYKVSFSAPGFSVATYTVELLSRQTVRVDGRLPVASQTERVNVTAEAAPVVNSEVSSIAETKTGRELVDLPIAITSRANGSTSPLATLTTQPGVQTDAAGNISVVGSKPSMLSISIDGISSMGPRTSAPLAELFPSFNSIAEIRVSEVNNTAEFGGTSDITTISKSGTNAFHGGLFENLMNTALNARNPFSSSVPKTIMNNFGVYVGGPVLLPKLYSGRDKTFFFAAFEGLRLPKESVLVHSVPSLALRSGDLSVITANFRDPLTGAPFPNKQIPASRISPTAMNALRYLFPLPNTGSPNAIANNYVQNFSEPITSDQGDLRVDQNLGSAQNIFARFTYKKRDVITAPTTGSVLQGPYSLPDTTFGLTVAHNYVISPRVVNEIRGGFTGIDNERTFGVDPAQIAAQIGLTSLPQPYPSGAAVPNFVIQGFRETGGTASTRGRQRTYQILDNVTWTNNSHTLKFGGDFRFLEGFSANVYAGVRLGQFNYDNSVTRDLIGAPFAAFLLGVPDQTRLNTVVQPDSDGYTKTYAFYVQDDWKVTSRLTINYGLRWEYHPMFKDRLLNGTNLQLDASSIVNGQRVNGRVVIYNQKAFDILNQNFAAAIAPVPIVTAAEAGIPESLRNSQKTDFGPRIGFAWRPFADGRTVLRGGYGRFIQGPLGALLGAGFAIHSANQSIYTQQILNGSPTLTFPYPFPSTLAQPGTQFFQQAADINFRDPTIDQWNLT
ncbi:MAG: TonB-dependent receptor, partial [Bryobacteraceae bacterium]|nr:TonB-dependent receptor [Bryobacteraceae bacterium]